MQHIKLSLIGIVVAYLLAIINISNGEEIYNYYRLPTSIQPERYKLKILTNLDNLTFKGEMSMRFMTTEITDNVTLHSQNLTIDMQRIQFKDYSDNKKFSCDQPTKVVADHDYLIIPTCRPLAKDQMYKVKLYFWGVLNEKLQGYYRSSYVDILTNKTRWLSITQFEPAFARAAFPCLDEPNYKAKFIIWLGHHRSYRALSNMPLEKQEPISDIKDYVWSIFEESLPMSTYLVAYTINDFKYKSSGNMQVTFRTWSRADALNQCEYASEVGPKILKFYEESFGIAFPLKKIDQIAIPDFSAAAMENWGLVTYRETALLFAPNISSESNKLRIVSVIAHELAHQWFGNLVTMKWWSDLWLNEGFATYMASLAVHHLYPIWESLNEESLDTLLIVFRRDAQLSSHPISQPIEGTHQISERFDTISYRKGSAVLRMLHLILGEIAFFESIRHYLEENMYGNAEQDDLWASFTERAHIYKRLPNNSNMKTIMDSWTLQTGFPLVKVTRNYDTGTAIISQTRFLENNTKVERSAEPCWWIPLSLTNSQLMDFSKIMPHYWLTCTTSNKSVNLVMEHVATSNDWVIFNIQMSGVYRVMYDEKNWALLNRTLNSDAFTRIHVLNRAQLIDDSLSLAWSGYHDYDVPLHILEYMIKEREYLPWRSALDSLSNVNRLLRNFQPTYQNFVAFMRYIIKPTYLHLGGLNRSENTLPHTNVLHKSLMAGWACRLEVDDCVHAAVQYFKVWRATPKPHLNNAIPVDLRPIVYCTAIRHGNEDDWKFLWQQYQQSNVASEKGIIIFALACSENATVLHSYLNMLYDTKQEQIRRQDSAHAFAAIARNRVGFKLAKDYYIENIDKLYEFYGPYSHELGSLLGPLSSQVIKIEDLKQLVRLIDKKEPYFRKAQKSVLNALETINVNLEWINRNLGLLRVHFESRLTSMRIYLNLEYDHFRLPTSIKPLDYKLKIITQFEEAPNIKFHGEVIIHFIVKSNTNNITLHACNLTIDDHHIQLMTYKDNKVCHCVKSVTIVRTFDYYIIKLCRELITNEEAKIKLPFKGLLNDRLVGYYKSAYRVKETNSIKWLSITQFEATFARAAFPCLDEPIYKAKFYIWLGHHCTYTGLSNMPLQKKEPIENMTGYFWSIFEPSVPMSTYLVAFSVNQFHHQLKDDSRITFRTWSRPEVNDQCEYANDIAAKVLEFYERSLCIDFPIPKIDQIAVPTFAAGAMENWGLITYREEVLLYSPKSSSEADKQSIVSTIAHELAHQWFGNLVTLKWWNDLWLNEGFATYMSSLCTDYLNRDWQAWNEESLENILLVFRRDSLENSHAVTQDVQTVKQISEDFDTISYRKGAVILRMLDLILGRDVFLKSLHNYLTLHSYKNAVTNDLWSAFTEVSRSLYRIDMNDDIKTIMDSWTLQKGYPIIYVTRDYTNRSVIVTQQVFHKVHDANNLDKGRCWWIPLSFTSASTLDFSANALSLWMKCDQNGESTPLNIGRLACNQDWILFNIQLSGLYRVMYDRKNWNKLFQTLNSEQFTNIHVMNRAQLIDDVLSFAWGGYHGYDVAFDLLLYLTREKEYLPWMVALANLSTLNRLLRNFEKLYETFLDFMSRIIQPVYYHLNGLNFTEPECRMTHIELVHKALIGRWACYLNIEDCIKTAMKYFSEWKVKQHPDTENHIPINIRSIVYCTAIRHGNKHDWEFLWDRYKATNSISESRTILICLACTQNKRILYYYMRLAFAWGEFVNPSHSSLVFASVARNRLGFQMAKNFLFHNIGQLHDFYSPNTEELGKLVLPLATQITAFRDIQLLKQVIHEKSDLLKKSKGNFLTALNISQENWNWVQRSVKLVKAHFETLANSYQMDDIR